jgi:hypothetical protein
LETIKNYESEFESIKKFLQAIRYDPVLNRKLAGILKMDSYTRRFVLNNWLEQLRRNNAPQDLLSTLSCLFDDKIAEQILRFIHKNN